MNRISDQNLDDDRDLAAKIRAVDGTKNAIDANLTTDERVIARVTDGIYRKPGSALRELISNAYDADATRVIIRTDAPRFDRISVEDDGHGMSPEALAHLIHHIGGSAKRNSIGATLGITAAKDPLRSPNGRELIGKIGIGLFSISQLTSTFEIITKEKGEKFRTVASVMMRHYSDGGNPDEVFEAGKVKIWREPAVDVDSHGTTVLLTGVRDQAKETLRDREIWSAIEQNEASDDPDAEFSITAPKFHVGRVDQSGVALKPYQNTTRSLPWSETDGPELAFSKLASSVWDSAVGPNSKLEHLFDFYLRMVWDVSLAVPLPYVEGHLFDEPLFDFRMVFELSNRPGGSARLINQSQDVSIREALVLGQDAPADPKFDVYFDELKLSHPIRYQRLPTTFNAIEFPLVFVGKCKETFGSADSAMSGGKLAFQAYLFWNPRVAPVDHQGVLIRIHGSSGTLFDPTFMRYQVAEMNRLRQITCEIFVTEGLDSALNIDRESFNNAHPHYVFLAKWLHGAIRQVANAQKRVASDIRKDTQSSQKEAALSEISQIATRVWRSETRDTSSSPPSVLLRGEDAGSVTAGTYLVGKQSFDTQQTVGKLSSKEKVRQALIREKVKGIVQVLASFDLLNDLSPSRLDRLVNAISQILQTGEGQ